MANLGSFCTGALECSIGYASMIYYSEICQKYAPLSTYESGLTFMAFDRCPSPESLAFISFYTTE